MTEEQQRTFIAQHRDAMRFCLLTFATYAEERYVAEPTERNRFSKVLANIMVRMSLSPTVNRSAWWSLN